MAVVDSNGDVTGARLHCCDGVVQRETGSVNVCDETSWRVAAIVAHIDGNRVGSRQETCQQNKQVRYDKQQHHEDCGTDKGRRGLTGLAGTSCRRPAHVYGAPFVS